MHERLSNWFKSFAQNECKGSSPLYRELSLQIAHDDQLLSIASHAPDNQPIPNLFLASVHYLLAADPSHPLTKFYPTLNGFANPSRECYPFFKDFVLLNQTAITDLLRSRKVQTNEVGRCAYLFPAMLLASRYFKGRPIALLEVGTSAGLNLFWDRYAYAYGDNNLYGNGASNVKIASSFRGGILPALDIPLPEISHRIGIDLNIIDVQKEQEANWLKALIWPEHTNRRKLLETAIAACQRPSVDLRVGDGFEMLEEIAKEIPKRSVVCVYHTHVANQIAPDARLAILDKIDRIGANRDIVHIFNNIHPTLHFTAIRDGVKHDFPLAQTDGHARWIEWLTTESTTT